MKNLIKNEGFMSVYKGLSQPLMGAIPIYLITFTVNDSVRLFLQERRPEMSPVTQAIYSGALGGLCSLSIFTPIDLLKVRAQMTKSGRLNYIPELRKIFAA